MLTKSRKLIRKEQRKQKKAKRNEYYMNRNKPHQSIVEKSKKVEAKKPSKQSNHKEEKQLQPYQSAEKARQKENKEQSRLESQMRKERKKQLVKANIEEDRTIKQLEKQLKLNKRKSKAIPKSFSVDGLDYLLEVCDPETMKNSVIADQKLNEVNDEFEEDLALMAENENDSESSNIEEPYSKKRKLSSEVKIKSKVKDIKQDTNMSDSELSNDDELQNDELSNFGDEFDNEIGEDDEDNEEDEMSEDEEADYSDENSDQGDIDVTKDNIESDDDKSNTGDKTTMDIKVNKDGTWEDIYGRLRDAQGQIISKDNNNKYIPPAIRAKMECGAEDKKRTQQLERLKRQLKGLLNRLAESNMHSISNQIEELYMNNSRHDMNNTLTTLINEALVSNILAPERLLMEHILLVAILHANIGTEVGAHFLQTIVKQFEELLNDNSRNIEDKHLDNVVLILSQLYNFKLFDSKLIYEILDKLSSNFEEEKYVECILHILKSIGFNLRKDNPIELKNLILKLQKSAAEVPDEFKNNARLKFMLEILLAIKNNNVSKIPNYDTTYSEHLKKIMKGFIRKGNYVTQLNISLEDLLKADERGRWWVVGSAWTGNETENQKNTTTNESTSFSQKLLELARKQRMNTDTRRNIFCIIMTSEDYLDAFEKLLRLGLKNQQEREIIHVILHCCLQEKKYNPFYAILTQKFCEYDRKYQMIIKYSIWDKLKALNDHSGTQISHLAKLLSHLFVEKGLPLSILKIVQFSDLDKVTLRFMRQILLGILFLEDEEACRGVFERIAPSDNLKMFRESLRLFIHHFLLRNLKRDDVHDDKKEILQRRAKIVEKVLAGKDKKNF